ncbi:MAG: regulatory iron-sulfur-containing complex subunit RicT [Candidatus Omnitrophica bacterium]|nr:regulatory iron-sulfur-containing complex subunit RicT [Candidatus Omnitrophota bacterium]
MEKLVLVRLRDTGQMFPYNAADVEIREGNCVIVEHDRGLDYGQVVSLHAVPEANAKQPIKKIVRIAGENDLKRIEENRTKCKEAASSCVKKIEEHKLDMKLVHTEYSFDCTKIVFYFTADGRVDFRNLVKDLAKIFKIRIELRQIGVRDEAKFFGGFGPCGRELCCASFLKDFEPVTIKMAKEEGLPLNPPKISGICGRLMCCLNYEYDTYKSLSKGLPREGERIHIAQGKGKVINVNVFKRTATVEMEDGTQTEINYNKDEQRTAKPPEPRIPGVTESRSIGSPERRNAEAQERRENRAKERKEPRSQEHPPASRGNSPQPPGRRNRGGNENRHGRGQERRNPKGPDNRGKR